MMILVSEKRDDRTEWGGNHTYIADSVEVSRCRGCRSEIVSDDKEMANLLPPHKIEEWQGTPARSIVSLTGTKVLKSFHIRPLESSHPTVEKVSQKFALDPHYLHFEGQACLFTHQ